MREFILEYYGLVEPIKYSFKTLLCAIAVIAIMFAFGFIMSRLEERNAR